MQTKRDKFKSIKTHYAYILVALTLILPLLIICLTFFWGKNTTKTADNFIFQAREAFNQGKTAGEHRESMLNVCNYEKLNLKVFCLEGYYSSIEINQNNAPPDLFNRRIMALGYGYRLSKMNKDIQLELRNLRTKSVFKDSIPYVIDGWSFHQYLNNNNNLQFCQKLHEKWQAYCAFGAGRASFFKNRDLQIENTKSSLLKYFFWGRGFAIKFLVPESINTNNINESPARSPVSVGIKLATFVNYKYDLRQPLPAEKNEYSIWLSCSNKNKIHVLNCIAD